jgi:deferrochelatase/peroxidase EfeB
LIVLREGPEAGLAVSIPLDSHIRLADPRTAQTANQRLIRRSYTYDLGLDENGDIQAGHIFVAHYQDLERQFETAQKRLIGEPLIDYVQPFGGGYFYAVPGVADEDDWYREQTARVTRL